MIHFTNPGFVIGGMLTSPSEERALELHVHPDHLADFTKAVDRALNCWEDRPRWLVDLADRLNNHPGGDPT